MVIRFSPPDSPNETEGTGKTLWWCLRPWSTKEEEITVNDVGEAFPDKPEPSYFIILGSPVIYNSNGETWIGWAGRSQTCFRWKEMSKLWILSAKVEGMDSSFCIWLKVYVSSHGIFNQWDVIKENLGNMDITKLLRKLTSYHLYTF